MRKFMQSFYCKVVVIIFAVLCFSLSASAQARKFRMDLEVQGAGLGEHFKPHEFVYNFGYNITDRLYANLALGASLALFEEGELRTYETNETLGLNLGYSFVKKDNLVIDFRAGAHTCVDTGKAWKYNSFDGGVFFHLGKAKVKPTFGIGVRHYNATNDFMKNHTVVFGTVGMSLFKL